VARRLHIDSLEMLINEENRELEGLVDLALNLRSSWHHGADELWAQIDPTLWALTASPWVVLQSASPSRLRQLMRTSEFRRRLSSARDRLSASLTSATWFERTHGRSAVERIAYFSMEFGLAESLPIYSGGLGNVAGDQLKAASDLGVPVVGVGILYQQGYFRQIIDADGGQEALFPYNDPSLLPITRVRNGAGDVLRLPVGLPGDTVWLRAWEARVGRVPLYLLDANDPANRPAIRGITTELYGGGIELRLRQEILLGIGGWLLLKAIGAEPEVCHLNEGHAAFAVLERAASFMDESGQPFHVALEVTRAGNLFTTHTPVPAGFDRFTPELIGRYLGLYAEKRLGIDLGALLALGRQNGADASEPFNMAHLAIRGSGAVNGVSRLHGQVSRRIFQPLFPRWPEAEVPIAHVTNGVHAPSWDSPEADALWTEAIGKSPWQGSVEDIGERLASVSDDQLWAMRGAGRKRLVEYARERLVRQLAGAGFSHEPLQLDPNVLTLGFARRFATYKRPNLLLHDRARLLRILTNAERPVQLIVAGKAHPADKFGQEMIANWIHFIRETAARGHVVFLADYDLSLAEHLVRGVDLWVNTPERPWEASGTSGMKVLVNGGLNLSELDGWWAEAYEPDVGWAIGDGKEHGDDPGVNAAEADALYGLLEREIVPAFYTRDARGLPQAWIGKMRASMARLTPRFSTSRVVREYTESHYLVLATRYRARAAERGALGAELVAWRHQIDGSLPQARFGDLRVESEPSGHRFSVDVHLGGLSPDAVRVELYADAPVETHAMACAARIEGGTHRYELAIAATRPAGHYTARLVPYHPAASVPLEASAIKWQR
jgi:glycogen phosphorylase